MTKKVDNLLVTDSRQRRAYYRCAESPVNGG